MLAVLRLNILHDSVDGSYVDQNGVALTKGGGTLVLGTHGSVSSIPQSPLNFWNHLDCRSSDLEDKTSWMIVMDLFSSTVRLPSWVFFLGVC
jgi:hypothetical protein